MTNRIIYLVFSAVIYVLGSMPALAQQKPVETLQQQKVRYFNEKLQLTPAEAKSFWPVYNDYQNRKEKITDDRNNLLRYFTSNSKNMTPAEASDAIEKYLLYQQQENDLLHSYTKKFLEFMPPKKVMQIFITENDFKKLLLENLRDNRTVF
jgi:hypothetical protein